MRYFIPNLIFSILLLFPTMAWAADYHIDHRIGLEGDQRWDYLALDEDANRLYITRNNEVDIMELSTEKIIGQIKNLAGVHGVAIARPLKKGFITNGSLGSVTVFDLQSNAALSQIPVGKKPDAILFDPFTRRVFVFNGDSQDATVLDAEKNSVLQTIPLGGKPEFAVSDEKGKIFVNLEDKSSIALIDAKEMKVLKQWPLAPCESPSGMAMDRAQHRLFSVCENEKMAVVNSETGAVMATVPIGQKPDAAAFDPSTHLAFSSNGGGTLTVVQEKTPGQFSVLSTIPTQKGARTMALNSKNHWIYLITAKFEESPPPTETQPHPRAKIVPGTVEIIVMKP